MRSLMSMACLSWLMERLCMGGVLSSPAGMVNPLSCAMMGAVDVPSRQAESLTHPSIPGGEIEGEIRVIKGGYGASETEATRA